MWALNTRRCREADVSVYSLDGVDVRPNEPGPWAYDQIARPLNSVAGSLGTPGSTFVDSSNASFTIGGDADPWVGEAVNKVGVTTGWTTGTVQSTCVDVRGPGSSTHWLVCQTTADLGSRPGDSGSPVFSIFDVVYYGGLLWAGAGDGDPPNLSYYSSAGQVREGTRKPSGVFLLVPDDGRRFAALTSGSAAKSPILPRGCE